MIALAVCSGFVLAGAAPRLERWLGRASGWMLALLPAGLAGYFLSLAPAVIEGEAVGEAYAWLPSLDIWFSFHLDGLSLLFAILISGVGALVLIYAGGYLAGHPLRGRMFAFLLLFMASMLGLVLADNLLTLFVFWELTSVSSYLLIGFEHERPTARSAALQALLVTAGGGLALMAGLLLLGYAGGTYELTELRGQAAAIRADVLYLPILILILAGAFTKSAQFPFHFWLPSAMEAPTPVSAYLHSATMVKAGVYLLARLHPVLGETALWQTVVGGVGALTMLAGALLALPQTDLKRILAYTTISALGLLTMLIGIGSETALAAMIVYLIAHALYKGCLFLVAGALDHETGTRDVRQLGGLFRVMPFTAAAALLAGLSMAGLPPLFGFVAKEKVYEAVYHGSLAWLLTTAAVLASMAFVALAVVVAMRPFFGSRVSTPHAPHEAPVSLWLGPVLLSGLGLAVGVVPGLLDPLVHAAATAVSSTPPAPVHLALWHGWSPVLVLSIATLIGGLALFAVVPRVRSWAETTAGLERFGPAALYTQGLRGLTALADIQTRLLQSGYLRVYLTIILSTFVLTTGYALWRSPPDITRLFEFNGEYYEAGLVVLVMVAALWSVRMKTRLGAIVMLGVVGYGVALLFVSFAAPDLAMTQFLIETLTVILFMLVFSHVPHLEPPPPSAPVRGLLLPVAVSLMTTILVLVATQTPHDGSLTRYFSTNAYTEAHGRNVVNVILVDYRGLDTLGEITVLGVAAMGVYALLKLRLDRPIREAAAAPAEADEEAP